MKLKKDKCEKDLYSKLKVSVLLLVLVISLFVVSVALAKELDWARQASGLNVEEALDIVVDAAGNSFITGYFEGTVIFGEGESNETELTSSGDRDIFVAAYDDTGNLLWAHRAGGLYYDSGYGIAINEAGRIYVTGSFMDTATFESGDGNDIPFTASGWWEDIFIAVYDINGNLLWARQDGGAGGSVGRGISVDGEGNIYVVGGFHVMATFGVGDEEIDLDCSGFWDVFIAVYESNGDLHWVRKAGGEEVDDGLGIDIDREGNSYVTGFFQKTVTFSDLYGIEIPLTSSGWRDIFVASYDINGQLRWARKDGGGGYDHGKGIAIDMAGNSYVVGDFSSKAIFGDGEPTEEPLWAVKQDIFVASYDYTGSFRWVRQVSGERYDEGLDIVVDVDGNSYATGGSFGDVKFGIGEENEVTFEGLGVLDIFITCYDIKGNFLGAIQAGGSNDDRGVGIAVNSEGNTYVAGHFMSATATFGAGEANQTILTNVSSYDIFVARYTWHVQQLKIERLIAKVNALITSDDLNEGQANSLIKKLEASAKSLEKENYEATIGQLEAFINAIEAAIQSGELDELLGQSLIEGVQEIINSLEA